MPSKFKIRSISFNIDDPIQRKLFSHTYKFTNFSSYIKHLIYNDLTSYDKTEKTPTKDRCPSKTIINDNLISSASPTIHHDKTFSSDSIDWNTARSMFL